jgi:hypothetical protein
MVSTACFGATVPSPTVRLNVPPVGTAEAVTVLEDEPNASGSIDAICAGVGRGVPGAAVKT